MQNLPELLAKFLLLLGRQTDPRQVRNIFHINLNSRHKVATFQYPTRKGKKGSGAIILSQEAELFDNRLMRIRELKSEILLPKPINEVFGFFSDACNLQTITPPWVHFQILTPCPIAMYQGSLIDYRIRINGIPIRWRTRITQWEPPYKFVDEQIQGPYRQWIHEHTFEARGDSTFARDHVRYATALDFLVGSKVERDVQRIFAYRSQRLIEHFSAS